MKITVVVPAYNESRYIGRFLDSLLTVTKNIVVVDDGSRDKTKEIVEGRGVKCLSHMTNLGKGAALKTGCDYAFHHGSDAVIIMDGDNQHLPSDIPRFRKALNSGAEIVFGTRSLDHNFPKLRLLGNKSLTWVIKQCFGRSITDIPSGYKALTHRAYKQILWDSSGYEVETEIAVRVAKSKLSYVEVPISTVYHDKDYGFNLLDAWGILVKIPYWLWR
jgi:glycosyltransferase involved in cell wall biosynthesis